MMVNYQEEEAGKLGPEISVDMTFQFSEGAFENCQNAPRFYWMIVLKGSFLSTVAPCMLIMMGLLQS